MSDDQKSEATGTAPGVPDFLRSWIAASLHSTVYASVSVSAGALLGMIAQIKQSNPWPWFFLGMCITPGPHYMWSISTRRFRAQLVDLKGLLEDKLITKELYEKQLARAMDWLADRRYGSPSLPGSKTKASATGRPKSAPPVTEKEPASIPKAS